MDRISDLLWWLNYTFESLVTTVTNGLTHRVGARNCHVIHSEKKKQAIERASERGERNQKHIFLLYVIAFRNMITLSALESFFFFSIFCHYEGNSAHRLKLFVVAVDSSKGGRDNPEDWSNVLQNKLCSSKFKPNKHSKTKVTIRIEAFGHQSSKWLCFIFHVISQ